MLPCCMHGVMSPVVQADSEHATPLALVLYLLTWVHVPRGSAGLGHRGLA